MPRNYFREPLNIKPVISGTFGELRNNHFHTGVDFSTQNKENFETYCIADGYVSRIKISETGYGKVIYVTHYNGYVSVYGHLNDFNVLVSDYVKSKQYENEKYEIELFPAPELFPLKKGDVVGYTGNTGTSTGPHLHFEIRNEKTERPINPLLFGYSFADTKNPVIQSIHIFPADENTLINNKKQVYTPELIKKENKYFVKDTIDIVGKVFFGISANDYSGSNNLCGFYSLEVFIDNELFFHTVFDSLSFDEGKYINAFIDYPTFYNNKKRVVKTYIAPGNRLKIYKVAEKNGIFFSNDSVVRKVLINVKDFNNNNASAEFYIRPKLPKINIAAAPKKEPLFRFGLRSFFEKENLKIEIPPDALADSIYFIYKTLPKTKNTYSTIHCLHTPETPLFAPIKIFIKSEAEIDSAIIRKLAIARVANKTFEYLKTDFDGNYFIAQTLRFGNYCIVADTTPPEIKPNGHFEGKKVENESIISFKISDNFSGIGSYRMTINNKWVLAEYDIKKSELIYKTDTKHFTEGNNILKLEVKDKLQNTKTFETTVKFLTQ